MRVRSILIFLLVLISLTLSGFAAECPGHSYENQVVIQPECNEPGMKADVCIHCGAMINAENVDPVGHSYGQWVFHSAGSCVEPGKEKSICSGCGDIQYRDAAFGTHIYRDEIILPTCTKTGYTLHKCTLCSSKYEDTFVSALGHSYDSGVITKEPTMTAMGRIQYTCTVCFDTKTDTVPKLINPFTDVSEREYYFRSVLWAVNKGITQGVDETHFAPNAVCTRAQVVTFLWRAAGSPTPAAQNCPFEDVAVGQYYYYPVLWALEMGITQGIDATHFGPDQSCTRAQVVTFLHRAKGCPATAGANHFLDVLPTDYFYQSVAWAAEKGITTGVSGEEFAPNQVCTRGQIVTFMHRAEQNS